MAARLESIEDKLHEITGKLVFETRRDEQERERNGMMEDGGQRS